MSTSAQSGTTYTLLGGDGQPFESDQPGTIGGNRRARIYGRLDCPSAERATRAGGYASNRVFFPDEQAAVSAGFRPCGTCMKDEYDAWKKSRQVKS